MRIALANFHYPSSPEESVRLVEEGMETAASCGAAVVCFPEGYVPGYRGLGHQPPPPDRAFLDKAWTRCREASRRLGITAIVGTERPAENGLRLSALVSSPDGSFHFQDKVQLDPTEEGVYAPGMERRLFEAAGTKFGVVICHEGWRYPETVRWAAKRGAKIIFHPHLSEDEEGNGFHAEHFADPRNTFHEKAALCRAAENTVFFATVNYARPGSPTTSAIAKPDGTLQCFQRYGEHGLLVADLDLGLATGLLARRLRG